MQNIISQLTITMSIIFGMPNILFNQLPILVWGTQLLKLSPNKSKTSFSFWTQWALDRLGSRSKLAHQNFAPLKIVPLPNGK